MQPVVVPAHEDDASAALAVLGKRAGSRSRDSLGKYGIPGATDGGKDDGRDEDVDVDGVQVRTRAAVEGEADAGAQGDGGGAPPRYRLYRRRYVGLLGLVRVRARKRLRATQLTDADRAEHRRGNAKPVVRTHREQQCASLPAALVKC